MNKSLLIWLQNTLHYFNIVEYLTNTVKPPLTAPFHNRHVHRLPLFTLNLTPIQWSTLSVSEREHPPKLDSLNG